MPPVSGLYNHVCACILTIQQSCLTLCNPMDCSSPGSSTHGILQAGILELAAMRPSMGDLPDPGIEPMSHVSWISRWVLYH